MLHPHARRWARIYRRRMELGLEFCRWCFKTSDLTFDHILPVSHRRLSGRARNSMDNVSILCRACNTDKGAQRWPLRSLAEEEAEARPERRWSQFPERWDPLA